MKLRRLVRGDIHFQWKYGFYFIYFVLTVIYVFGITALPDNWKHNAAAIMIYSDPAAMGLFFMGAIVLLEKSQKVLHAIAISPAKVSEYILAKVFSLMFISCVVALILGIAAGNKPIRYHNRDSINIIDFYYARYHGCHEDCEPESVFNCNYAH